MASVNIKIKMLIFIEIVDLSPYDTNEELGYTIDSRAGKFAYESFQSLFDIIKSTVEYDAQDFIALKPESISISEHMKEYMVPSTCPLPNSISTESND